MVPGPRPVAEVRHRLAEAEQSVEVAAADMDAGRSTGLTSARFSVQIIERQQSLDDPLADRSD